MTATADRYDTIAGGFDRRVQGVGDDRWESAAPCDGWTAQDVLDHVVGNLRGLLGNAGFTPADGLGPKEAWKEVHAAMTAVLRDPHKATVPVSSPFGGDTTVEGMVQQLLAHDTLVHTWDLARATGQDEALDADAVRACAAALEPLDGVIRRPGVFGPKVEPAADADDQTRLLNFLGRTV